MDKDNQIDFFEQKKKTRKTKKEHINEIKEISSNIINKTVEEVMNSSMLPYSEHVILDRALPRVEDGLKPVQRRILFAMRELGNTADKPYKKSARIVGECLGKYHPHGDKSVYDAMVRMSQPFNMSACLVQGHGNFGSIDGDSAAAMRYTEVRLSEIALELMRDLEKDTVQFSYNFDDTLQEPDYLTGRYPNLLVNGASGIAVGLATNIPPHNLGEVIDATIMYMENNFVSLNELMSVMKAPDFPTGGILQKTPDLVEAYANGKGKVLIRAKFEIEELAAGKSAIVITELPYQVNKSDFLSHIVAVKDKHKGCLNYISEINDESDKRGMRCVITLKKDADVSSIISMLLKYTEMQSSFNINMVAIADGKPKLLGLIEILKYYTDFQLEILQKRSKFDLEKAVAKSIILKGLIIAIDNIDRVIQIIRGSRTTQEAKNELMNIFELNEIQANAILDMRLGRLTNLESEKLLSELESLTKQIEYLEKLLSSKNMQIKVIKKEMLEIKAKYPIERRTQVVEQFEDFVLTPIEQAIVEQEGIVSVSFDNLRLKYIPLKNVNDTSVKFDKPATLNNISNFNIKTTRADSILIFTAMGNVYKIKVSEIEICKPNAKGVALSQIVNANVKDSIVGIYNIADGVDNLELYFFTSKGYIRKSSVSEFLISKSNAQAIKLKENDFLVNVQLNFSIPSVVMVTKNGMCANISLDNIPLQKRVSSGVIGMNVDTNDNIIFASQLNNNEKILIYTEDHKAKRVNVSEFVISVRNRKGNQISKSKIAVAKAPVIYGELVLLLSNGNIMQTDINKIDVLDRTKTGKSLFKLHNNEKISHINLYRL